MGLFHFLIVVQAVVAAFLVGTILVQQSEGGGLGTGGSPSGLMSARGAANFLTRATAMLAGLFILLAILLAFLAAREGRPVSGDSGFRRAPVESAPAAPATAPSVPLSGSQGAAAPAASGPAEPASDAGSGTVPLDK